MTVEDQSRVIPSTCLKYPDRHPHQEYHPISVVKSLKTWVRKSFKRQLKSGPPTIGTPKGLSVTGVPSVYKLRS